MRLKTLYILILILFSSCGIKSVSYKKAKSLSLNKGYETILNKETEIELEKYYLDTKNIVGITADTKTKSLNIIQSNKDSDFFNLTEIETEEFKTRYKMANRDSISLIIINGILVDNNEWKDYQIEHNSVKSLNAIKGATAITFDCCGKSVLVIITE